VFAASKARAGQLRPRDRQLECPDQRLGPRLYRHDGFQPIEIARAAVVIIPVMTQHYAMPRRNLLYTGVTRGKRLVVLVGQRKAVAIAARSVAGRLR